MDRWRFKQEGARPGRGTGLRMDFNRSALRRAPAWAPKRAPQARQLLALLAIDYNRAKTRKLGSGPIKLLAEIAIG
jgi:hypothetical protein